MANYFFIGDGSEVLAVEAYETNAQEKLKELQAETDDELTIYSRDPSETTTDSAGKVVWAYPVERAVAEKEYDLPTLNEVIAANQKTHRGYVITPEGDVYLQLPADNAPRGFVIADEDQAWDIPPFKSWEAIAEDDPRITEDDRERLQWILDEA